MGRHYKNKGRFDSIFKLLALLFIAGITLFVFCWSKPGYFSPEVAKVVEQIKSKTDETLGDVVTITSPADSRDMTVDEPDEPQNLSVDAGTPERKPFTVIPDKPYAPGPGEKPLLALLVDDGGHQMDLTKRVASLDLPLTWAILPYTRYATETADLADSKNIPYLLHLPMQAEIDKDGSKEYIVGRGMTDDQIRRVTQDALAKLPNPIGVNNHRGSLATADKEIIAPVIDVIKSQNLMFIDSRTSGKSVAYKTAYAAGVPTMQNRGFLDGTPDKNAIETHFNEIVKQAVRRGDLIAICHFRPATVLFLEELNEKQDSLPVRLVTIPEMAALLLEGANEGGD
ncbi:divergent polysaccharide deacetylase family protein [Synergistaceae bacterium OttesenSCG-928-D05]|nr:divergent polysaccharide deacetylase family protein [Synergistaceae bacterium OttesenSCG-928-D05]